MCGRTLATKVESAPASYISGCRKGIRRLRSPLAIILHTVTHSCHRDSFSLLLSRREQRQVLLQPWPAAGSMFLVRRLPRAGSVSAETGSGSLLMMMMDTEPTSDVLHGQQNTAGRVRARVLRMGAGYKHWQERAATTGE